MKKRNWKLITLCSFCWVLWTALLYKVVSTIIITFIVSIWIVGAYSGAWKGSDSLIEFTIKSFFNAIKGMR